MDPNALGSKSESGEQIGPGSTRKLQRTSKCSFLLVSDNGFGDQRVNASLRDLETVSLAPRSAAASASPPYGSNTTTAETPMKVTAPLMAADGHEYEVHWLVSELYSSLPVGGAEPGVSIPLHPSGHQWGQGADTTLGATAAVLQLVQCLGHMEGTDGSSASSLRLDTPRGRSGANVMESGGEVGFLLPSNMK